MSTLKKYGLINQHELAKQMGVSRQTITNRMKAGKLPKPVRKEGNLILWDIQDVKGLK